MAMKRTRLGLLVATVAAATVMAGCTATRDFHGYVPDQAFPEDVKPDVDTRSTVLARLGTPSTTSLFNQAGEAKVAPGKEQLWVYMSSTRELLAFYYPKVVQRSIIAIQFDDDFIEWSVSFAEKPYPPACDVAKELTRQSIVSAK